MGEAVSSPRPPRATRIATLAGVAAAAGLLAGAAWAAPLLGQPSRHAAAAERLAAGHAALVPQIVLMPIITVISLFVLGLLLWVMARYNKRANPVPARFTHNTTIEVVWTVVPVVILLAIAVFSYKLLFRWHDMPRADLTMKVTGYQWYWGSRVPDQKSPRASRPC